MERFQFQMGSTENAKCPICGHRHSMRDPHIWDDEPTKKVVANRALDVANTEKPVANKKYGRYKDIEKRKAYMRNYMKQKRAK